MVRRPKTKTERTHLLQLSCHRFLRAAQAAAIRNPDRAAR
jgi:hypothetical protein